MNRFRMFGAVATRMCTENMREAMQISSADKRRVYLIIVLGLLLCVAAAARIVVDIVTH
jgi:hypothetical protein